MIIGINGKIGSGKDTVGRIIQYLMLDENTTKYFVKDWINKEHYLLDTRSNWEIKKFAGKLKQIASILTGATLEQLENQDFKKQEMSPEWGITYRELLQKLGTEAMRNGLHENVWVNALMADYISKPEFLGSAYEESGKTEIYPNWIITDMRFPNEMDVVKAKGGITIRIQRFKQISENIRVHHGIGVPHPSETALDDHKFDYVIDNNGSISDLIDKVKEILTLNNII